MGNLDCEIKSQGKKAFGLDLVKKRLAFQFVSGLYRGRIEVDDDYVTQQMIFFTFFSFSEVQNPPLMMAFALALTNRRRKLFPFHFIKLLLLLLPSFSVTVWVKKKLL